jgi:hypothetical protein
MPPSSAVLGGVDFDLSNKIGLDQDDVQRSTRTPRGREPYIYPRVARASRGEVLSELPGGVRGQRAAAADRAKHALVVAAAEEERLRSVQGAGYGADNGLSACFLMWPCRDGGREVSANDSLRRYLLIGCRRDQGPRTHR